MLSNSHTIACKYLSRIYVVSIVVPFRLRDLYKNMPLRHGVKNNHIYQEFKVGFTFGYIFELIFKIVLTSSAPTTIFLTHGYI
jgi:hypothetical protein